MGSNASWPVGRATRQSGGNWVGRFEKPEDWNIWASMYSSNLELGQLITVGDSILKWTAAGIKFVDAVFATQADLDSFCSKIGTPIAAGSTAMVAGVSKTWGGTGWEAVCGNILPTYDTWAEAVTAAGSTRGWIGRVKTLCGTDYFTAVHDGIRLRVLGGSAIIRDIGPGGVGYPLTATGVAYVALASYTIPADMIGDGDQFGCAMFGANTGVLSSGNDSFSTRIGTNQINAQSQVTFANRRSTSTGSLVRIGAQAICVSSGPNALSGSDNNNYPGGLISVDFSAAQTITVGATPGAVGNTMKIEQWSFGRIA